MTWLAKFISSAVLAVSGIFGHAAPPAPAPAVPSPVPASTHAASAAHEAVSPAAPVPSHAAARVVTSAQLMQQIGCTDISSCVTACQKQSMPPACFELQQAMASGGSIRLPASTGSSGGQAESAQSAAPENPDFIVAVPVDLSQIVSISKFRSCIGHDYSGLDAQGIAETDRSMKHYFTPQPSLVGTKDQVSEFAPFDGVIVQMQQEHTPVGQQVWISDSSSAGPGGYPSPGIWNAIFFHLNPVPGLAVGSHVKAGQLIGHADLEPPIQSFDIALQRFEGNGGVYKMELDSIFNHLSPSVAAAFAQAGANQESMSVSKAARDAAPCTFDMPDSQDTVALTHA